MDEKRDVIFTKSFDCIIDMDVKHGKMCIRDSIKCDKMKQLMMGRAGSLVKIRPCNKEYGDKTYLGLYLGNQPWSQTVSYNKELGELTVGVATNPAIYVFDLQRIIFGAESWWSIKMCIRDRR